MTVFAQISPMANDVRCSTTIYLILSKMPCAGCLRRREDKTADSYKVVDEAERQLARAYECKLCLARPIGTVLIPCGHAMACTVCSKRIDECPICRKHIRRVGTIIFS